MLRIAEAVQLTDTGRQREANEDSYFSRAPLFAVADGMGGAQAGEVASRMAVEAFDRVDESAGAAPEELLRVTAQQANREIFDLAQGDTSRSGMGTTLTAALVHGGEISFGHVGDSRAYVFRDRKLKQITNDHSLVEELRRHGKLTREQAAEHPQRSVITRALGPEAQVDVDTMTFSARAGDVFLLCSDGLTTMLGDEDVAAILDREDNLSLAARRLIRDANERGGRDNITVVLFRLETADDAAGADGETLVGPSAEAAGFSAEAVRAGVAATGGAAAGVGAGSSRSQTDAPRPPRRRQPAAMPPPPGRKWPKRILRTLVALIVAAAILAGAVYGARQVWFLGTDNSGQIALFRGLPYELPFGIELYSEQFNSQIPLDALPETRRAVVTDHELRSQDDARSLLEDLANAAATTPRSPAVPRTPPKPPAGNGGGGKQGSGQGTGSSG
jgi:serine/threonine protein phosphatase PrpC